ncbi:MAG TPA: glyoxalase [Cytophagales bacterium]|nr:glyoxalase [Cytophagales bacterium]
MGKIISGIQQMGIGVPNVHEGFAWYRKHFGVDIKILDDDGSAELMLPYTDNQPHERHAILAVSQRGGGGFEIWQYKSRTPQPADFQWQLGDKGINVTKIKSDDVAGAYAFMQSKGVKLLSEVTNNPAGGKHFFMEDPYGNVFEVVHADEFFASGPFTTAGTYGAILGSTDIEKSRKLYSDILGYDQVIYDETGTFEDLNGLPGGEGKFRRVLLAHSQPRKGAFAPMLGTSQIELIQVLDREPRNIFEGRLWGDLGLIHLCFDIQGREDLEAECKAKGFPFTVDSSQGLDTFDMGEAAGLFFYIEDPDGALIEFVETHKVPVAKKFGLYINLRKRNPEKALPTWMLKALRVMRVKD